MKKTDLHVHLLQSLFPEDVYRIARPVFAEIDWNRFGFLDRYEKLIGVRLDPARMFEGADPQASIREIAAAMVFPVSEAGDFDKFDIRTFFPLCVTGHAMDRREHSRIVEAIVRRHRDEGIQYLEYRQGIGYSEEDKREWKDWHLLIMEALRDASRDGFEARYIMRISDEMYGAARELQLEAPAAARVLVGLDFTGKEMPAKSHGAFFERLRADNEAKPDAALDMVVHVGEVYFDKSIESAIRWCHEYAEAGVKRMGHCIALGLDPETALSRRPGAHVTEPAAERLDQIGYDLRHADALRRRGVEVDEGKLARERTSLLARDPQEPVSRGYDARRIDELRIRQDFVLDAVRERGIVLEVCPSSNYLIAGVPRMEDHPIKRFYDSGQKVAICTDDPGTFMRTLSDEINLVCDALGIDEKTLFQRIGDPYEYRLGRRPCASPTGPAGS
jgi:hypothetical protein